MQARTPLEAINRVCEDLGSAPIKARDLAAQLGTIEDEGASAVYVNVTIPGVKKVIVSQDPDTQEATYVEFMVDAAGQGVTPKVLQDHYGKPKEVPRVHAEQARSVLYPTKTRKEWRFMCTVVARIRTEGKALDRGVVESIAVRREPR